MRTYSPLSWILAFSIGIGLLPATEQSAFGQFKLGKLAEKVKDKAKDATNQVQGTESADGVPGSDKTPPASSLSGKKDQEEENDSRPRIGSAVVTGSLVKSYAEAATQQIKSVKDGDPVYLWLKLPKPLEVYLGNWTENTNLVHSDKKAVRISVSQKGYPEFSGQTCDFVPRDAEKQQTEIMINLAPGDVRPLPLECWMKAVTKTYDAHVIFNINVVQLTEDIMNRPVLASASLSIDIPDETRKYAAMLDKHMEDWKKGDVSFNTEPTKGSLVDAGMKTQVAKLAAARLGVAQVPFYFTGDDWFAEKDRWDVVYRHHTTGAILYKKGAKNFYQMVDVYKYTNGKVDIDLYGEEEINAETYQKALANTR